MKGHYAVCLHGMFMQTHVCVTSSGTAERLTLKPPPPYSAPCGPVQTVTQ